MPEPPASFHPSPTDTYMSNKQNQAGRAGQANQGDQADKAAAKPKASYKVKSPLEHDGERFEIGDEVALTEFEAKPLLGHTVEPLEAPKTEQA